MLDKGAIQQFNEQGFVKLPQAIDSGLVAQLKDEALMLVRHPTGPLEYEADLHYPGSPDSLTAPGGKTVRRFLQLYDRQPIFNQWLQTKALQKALRVLLGSPIYLAKAHHNCLMTKQPEYSSDSGWHQDIRYWSFSQRNLVTAWLALGEENQSNGCLQVIPGSHRLTLSEDQFDELQFLKTEHPENQALLAKAEFQTLSSGDILFFHCRLLHSATRNLSQQAKLAVVYTFRAADDLPLAGTRSALGGDVLL